MKLAVTLELLRFLGAAALLFAILPAWCAHRRGRLLPPAQSSPVLEMLRFCVFLEIVVLGLGWLKLALPGMLVLAIGAWFFARSLAGRFLPGLQGRAVGALLEAAESRAEKERRPFVRQVFLRLGTAVSRSLPGAPVALFVSLAGVILLRGLAYPIVNLRFQSLEAYERAINLHLLIHGQTWPVDGVSTLLAPIVLLSGLQPDQVVRFAGPLQLLVFSLVVAYGAWLFSGKRSALFIGAALAAVFLEVLIPGSFWELSARVTSAIFWLLGLALLGKSRRGLALAWLAAILTLEPKPEMVFLAGAAAILAGMGISRLPDVLPPFLRHAAPLAASLVLATAAFAWRPPAPADGPFQYEAAAQICHRIVEEYPRNEWVVVSPLHEIPFLYARGWHFELEAFVRQFTPAAVRSPQFAFPFSTRSAFVFVEKEPLAPLGKGAGGLDAISRMDNAVAAYHSPLGRAALEFSAAEVMAAYAAGHPGVTVYYQDDRLIVYHILLRPEERVERVGLSEKLAR